MLTWAIIWMVIKCKDSDIAEPVILVGGLLGFAAIIVDGIIFESLMARVL